MNFTEGCVHMNKITNFKGEYEFLSNFAPCYIRYNGILYTSVECAFQAAKVEDIQIKKQLSRCTPNEAKKYGRKVKLRADWDNVRVDIMRDLLRIKFHDNHFSYKQKLIDTGDAYIEEGNKHHDTFWGVCDGIGENNLGKLLMEIREELVHDKSIS